jgi:hypothetical protein
MKRNAFAYAESELRRNGYSPIPILPNTKRPALAGWSAHCGSVMTGTAIGRYATSRLAYGIGVALGYGGLIGIDLDSEDAGVTAAIRAILPTSPVAKRGARGRTDFYRDPTNSFRPRKFKASDGAMLVEVLATGNQTVIPQSIHPTTGEPYEWLRDATLFDTPVDELPMVSPAICERLAGALFPWTRTPSRPALQVSTARTARDLSDRERVSQSRYARAILDRDAVSLASMRPNTGRNVAVFRLACRLGRWVHHGLISVDEVVGAIMEACERSGLIREDGRRSVLATIASGLRKSVGDTLPDLERRRHG